MPQLSELEAARLAELEPIIERGMASFVEVGSALLEISDKRLYRQTHSTFADYVWDKWKVTAARAYQLCEAAEVVKSLPPEKSTMVDNERKARELAKVPKEKRAKVLETAATKGPVTAKTIRAAAESTVKFKCDECNEEFDSDDDVQPLYECNDCGEKFTPDNSNDGCSHKCPSCNKFAAKVSDNGCPECGMGELVDPDEIEQEELTPLDQLKHWWSKASSEEHKRFLDYVEAAA